MVEEMTEKHIYGNLHKYFLNIKLTYNPFPIENIK